MRARAAALFARLQALLQRGPGIVHIALAAALLLAPTAVNGRPGDFYDTLDYIHEGEAAWGMLGVPPGGLDLTPPTFQARTQRRAARDIRAARSAAYGGFLYAGFRLGGLWLVCAVQAMAASAVVYAFVRAAMGGRNRPAFWATAVALTLFSALPFFCGFAMPDVFSGLAAVSLTTLAVYPDALPRAARRALFATATLALCMHTSNVLIALALAAVAAAVGGWLARRPYGAVRSAAWTLSATAVSIALFVVYGAVVRARTGERLGSPPFLSARVLVDGPGRAYLAAACGEGRPWALCAYRDRRLDSLEDVLWSRNRRRGVYGLAPAAVRARLSAEDHAFALAAVLHDPLGQTRASAVNIARTLVDVRLDEPLAGPDFFAEDGFWSYTALPSLMPGADACASAEDYRCAPRLDADLLYAVHGAAMVAALLFLLWRLTQADVRAALARPGREATAEGRLVAAALLLTAVVALNAGVCGAISGPYARYQARLAWVLPLVAVAAALRLGVGPASRPARPRGGQAGAP